MLTSIGIDSLLSFAAEFLDTSEALFRESLPNFGLSDEATLSIGNYIINLILYAGIGAVNGALVGSVIHTGVFPMLKKE